MSVIRTYKCDICGERFDPASGHLLGYRFTGQSPGAWRLTDSATHENGSSVESHICRPCLARAAEEHQRITTK